MEQSNFVSVKRARFNYRNEITKKNGIEIMEIFQNILVRNKHDSNFERIHFFLTTTTTKLQRDVPIPIETKTTINQEESNPKQIDHVSIFFDFQLFR